MAKKPVKLPEGYGPAAPKKKGAAPSGKGSYIKFMAACRKEGKSMKECAELYKKQAGAKEGGKVYAKAQRRKRAARLVRKKKKMMPEGYGPGA